MATKTKYTFEEAIKHIEANTSLKCTAACDDGSAFFVTVGKDNSVIGECFRLTPAKIQKLADIRKPN